MALKIATPPTEELIGLAEAKLHCRIDLDDDDYLLVGLIRSARETIELISRRALISQSWDLVLDAWPGGTSLELPRPPLQSVTSIKYYDDDDSVATMSSDDYYVDTYSEPGRIVLRSDATWPAGTLRVANGVIVRFVAGFGDTAGDVPERYVQALKLLVGHWYENRESIIATGAVPKEIPLGVQSLLWLDRNMGFP